MTDINELTHYVETNPNDHPQRWHLAKKLYMRGEYRQTLGHLLVLQTNWTPKINVVRYLAATYYRLGRYDEAVAELRSGIEEWPDEIPIREQLARVLEVAGRTQEAVDAWRDILKTKPDHSLAQRRVARLIGPPVAQAKDESPSPEVDFGLDATSGRVCPNCGTQNSDEFDRCWKCHVPLLDTAGLELAIRKPSTMTLKGVHAATAWYLVGGLGSVVLFAAGIYLSGKQILLLRESTRVAASPETVQELLNAALLSTHIMVGLMLLVVWPAVLWSVALLMKPGGVPWKAVLVTGLLLASATYLAFWGPPDQLGYVFLILVGASLIPIVATFKAGVGPSLLIWMIQGVLMPCAILISVIALEGSLFVREFPRIANYARQHDAARSKGADSGRYLLSPVVVPVSSSVRWESTGSAWLDARANTMSCEISSAAPDLALTVEFRNEKGTLFYDHVTGLPYTFAYDKVLPNQPYELLIAGPDNVKIDIAVRSLMRPRFGN